MLCYMGNSDDTVGHIYQTMCTQLLGKTGDKKKKMKKTS